MDQVADLLANNSPQFNTVAHNCPVSDALYKMCCEAVDFLIVMNEGRFKGIITDHDIASRILFEDRPLKEIEVQEFMNSSLPVASPEVSLHSCLQMLERFGTRHLAVFDRFEFKGVVSSQSLMQEMLQKTTAVSAEEAIPRRGYPWNY